MLSKVENVCKNLRVIFHHKESCAPSLSFLSAMDVKLQLEDEWEDIVSSPGQTNTTAPYHVLDANAECEGYRLHRANVLGIRSVDKWPEEWRRSVNGRLYVPEEIPTMDDWLMIPHMQMKMFQFGFEIPASFITFDDEGCKIDFDKARKAGIQYYDPRMHHAIRVATNVPQLLRDFRDRTLVTYRSLRNRRDAGELRQDYSQITLIPYTPPVGSETIQLPGIKRHSISRSERDAVREVRETKELLAQANNFVAAIKKVSPSSNTLEELDQAFSVAVRGLIDLNALREKYRNGQV